MSDVAVVDMNVVPVGTNEEVAGPPHAVMAPVSGRERISTIDTLRGFALMGILVMNITDFALGFPDYMFPLSTMHPVFSGPHWLANTVMWFLRWVLAEGKMRGLFSMLFGAGVVLLTERAEKRGAGVRVADIYTRRNMWLVVFGMLHGYFIWDGDILFFYGTAALLFLFPFRVVRASRLLWVAGVVLFLNSLVVDLGQGMQAVMIHKHADEARAALAAGKPVPEGRKTAIDEEAKQQERWRPSARARAKDIAAEQGGYWSAQGNRAKDVLQGHLKGTYFGWGDWFGMMVLGMALYKNGFLPGRLRTKTYVWSMVVGLGIAYPLIFTGAWHAWKGHFDMMQTGWWMLAPYGIGRVSGAIGTAALFILALRANVFSWLMKAVAAVGQMALSNYLLTSLAMKFLFVWGPLHWYGYMEYYKLYYVVAAMWTVNLAWSSVWLRYFKFGPMEWVWRSLTYWKRQPMRIHADAMPGPATV